MQITNNSGHTSYYISHYYNSSDASIITEKHLILQVKNVHTSPLSKTFTTFNLLRLGLILTIIHIQLITSYCLKGSYFYLNVVLYQIVEQFHLNLVIFNYHHKCNQFLLIFLIYRYQTT